MVIELTRQNPGKRFASHEFYDFKQTPSPPLGGIGDFLCEGRYFDAKTIVDTDVEKWIVFERPPSNQIIFKVLSVNLTGVNILNQAFLTDQLLKITSLQSLTLNVCSKSTLDFDTFFRGIGNALKNLKFLRLNFGMPKYLDPFGVVPQFPPLPFTPLPPLPPSNFNLNTPQPFPNAAISGWSLVNLTRVEIVNNRPVFIFNTTLQDNIFSGLKKLSHLDLSSNGLFATGLPTVSTLTFLSFSDNHLTSFATRNIPEYNLLESLDLSRNAIGGPVPQGFFRLPRLRSINLHFNRLSQILKLFQSPFIQSINVANNQFINLDFKILNTTTLQFLDLSHNFIMTDFPDIRLPALRVLRLNNNNFGWKDFPVFCCPKLEELRFNSNRITSLFRVPVSADCRVLQPGVRRDKVEHYSSTYLRIIDMSNNVIRGNFFMNLLQQFPQLEYLNIEDNIIEQRLPLNTLNFFNISRTIPKGEPALTTFLVAGNRFLEVALKSAFEPHSGLSTTSLFPQDYDKCTYATSKAMPPISIPQYGVCVDGWVPKYSFTWTCLPGYQRSDQVNTGNTQVLIITPAVPPSTTSLPNSTAPPGIGQSGNQVINNNFNINGSTALNVTCVATCGNGMWNSTEYCENLLGGPVWCVNCKRPADGWSNCSFRTQKCLPICGDGKVVGSETCDESSTERTPGCVKCHVQKGWTCPKFGGKCSDVDECRLNLHNCSQQFNCLNREGSFECCPSGQVPFNGTCKKCLSPWTRISRTDLDKAPHYENFEAFLLSNGFPTLYQLGLNLSYCTGQCDSGSLFMLREVLNDNCFDEDGNSRFKALSCTYPCLNISSSSSAAESSDRFLTETRKGNFLKEVLSRLFNVTITETVNTRRNVVQNDFQMSPCINNVNLLQDAIYALSLDIVPNSPPLSFPNTSNGCQLSFQYTDASIDPLVQQQQAKKLITVILAITLSVLGLLIIGILLYFLLKKSFLEVLPKEVSWSYLKAKSFLNRWKHRGTSDTGYYFQEFTGADFDRVEAMFKTYLDGKKMKIKKITGVYNPTLVTNFVNTYLILQKRFNDGENVFFTDKWKIKKDSSGRTFVHNQYREKVDRCPWNQDSPIAILPCAHGTDEVVAEKICETGFAALSSLDAGFYGKGIYFSSSAVYTLPYFASKRLPAVIFSWIIPGNVYPVVEHHQGPNSLLGAAIVPGYNSHYVAVTNDGFVPASHTSTHYFDEIVIGQENQIAPAFILSFEYNDLTSVLLDFQKSRTSV